MIVRADVTYLRQDFSVQMDAGPDHAPWPRLQRFDFLVRSRKLSEFEVVEGNLLAPKGDDPPPDYPQREAVLFALSELTRANLGDDSQTWRDWLQDNRRWFAASEVAAAK